MTIRRERRRRNTIEINNDPGHLPHHSLLDRSQIARPDSPTTFMPSPDPRAVLITCNHFFGLGLSQGAPPLNAVRVINPSRERLHLSHFPAHCQILIDAPGLTGHLLAVLDTLRQRPRDEHTTWVILSANHEYYPLTRFIALACPPLSRCRTLPVKNLTAAGGARCLSDKASPPGQQMSAPRRNAGFSQPDWQLLTALAQGESLNHIAHQTQQPYHRLIYRLGQICRHTGLENRQQCLRFLQHHGQLWPPEG